MANWKSDLAYQKKYAQHRLSELETGEAPSRKGWAAVLGSLFGPSKKLKEVAKTTKKATGSSWEEVRKREAYKRTIERSSRNY